MARPFRLPSVAEQAVLDGLVVRLIVPDQDERWNQEINQRHYLKSARLVGEQLRYVNEYQGPWLALLGWSAPAFPLPARDARVGWSVEQRRTCRLFLAQNRRFLILAGRHQFITPGANTKRPAAAACGESSVRRHKSSFLLVTPVARTRWLAALARGPPSDYRLRQAGARPTS
jgi:hypothetical protein